MTTKRCTKCKLVKSLTEFNKKVKTSNQVRHSCRKCQQEEAANHGERGLSVLKKLAKSKGCCNHCQRPYCDEDWFFFEFDHIDIKLKKLRKETDTRWVASHQREFFVRVAPNLQLLCIKCHKLKSSEEAKVGGAVHQKKYGESNPAEVIDFGWNLFNPVPTPEADDYVSWAWSQVRREGDWIVQRDIDGRIIYSQLAN